MARVLKFNKEVLLYLVFGVLTTAVGFGTYFAVLAIARLCGIEAYYAVRVFAQILQWVLAVLFAYVTNKKFVFAYQSKNEVKTLVSFAAARLFSLGADSVVTFGTIAVLSGNPFADLIGKIAAAVVVVVLNYVLSKWIVFRKEAS